MVTALADGHFICVEIAGKRALVGNIRKSFHDLLMVELRWLVLLREDSGFEMILKFFRKEGGRVRLLC